MQLTVNGKKINLPEGATIRSLIEHLDLAKAVCAAEVNKTLVPRKEHETRTLQEGDTVEIVTLVGGG